MHFIYRLNDEQNLMNTIQHMQYEREYHLAKIKLLEEEKSSRESKTLIKNQETFLTKEREELIERNKLLTNEIEQLKKDNAISHTKYSIHISNYTNVVQILTFLFSSLELNYQLS